MHGNSKDLQTLLHLRMSYHFNPRFMNEMVVLCPPVNQTSHIRAY